MVLSPFKNLVVLSDFNCGIANAQMEMRYRNVFQWISDERQKRVLMPKEIDLPKDKAVLQAPSVMHIQDIPFGNIDYGAYSLYCCYRALGRSRPNLFIHVTDPGVGAGDDRSIMVTDYGNTFIGPNNGSLGLLRAYFDERGIPYKVWKIDLDKVEELEQYRMEEPTYHIPRTFHGRDIFSVVAGLLSGGVSPEALAIEEDKNGPAMTALSDSISALPDKLGSPVLFYAFRDNTYGNLKTNLTLDALTFDQLVEEAAEFKITNTLKKAAWWESQQKIITFVAKRVFADVSRGEPLLYLGSTFAPQWDERLVELAVNMCDAAQELRLSNSYMGAQELTIERIR